MNPRITLAVLAAASVLITLQPADARSRTSNLSAPPPALRVDVAAVPAYPLDGNGNAVDRRAASHAGKALRTTAHGQPGRKASQRASNGESGSGVVRSKKTGATARVSPKYAPVFQAYVDDLESRGAAVYYMGGKRPGRCWEGSQHPCGTALDVCQDWRGHVSAAKDCNLPGPVEMAAVARSHGLFEGGVWCGRPDYGHVQVIPTGTVCAARGTFGPRRHRVADRSGGRL